jgi:hypothetical protein
MAPNIESSGWVAEVASFLEELSNTQSEVLHLLNEKRNLLVAYDAAGLAAISGREELLMERLQACLDRRKELLARAGEAGHPDGSIRELTEALPHQERVGISKHLQQAKSQSRILQHQSITNWVLVQRTLIHLSQMLEIIATGGRSQPTYGQGEAAHSGGALVDQAA